MTQAEHKKESVRNYTVTRVTRKEITNFIERNHYSKSINGCIADYCYALIDNHKMIGAMFYGRMAMRNQWKKFGCTESSVIELRRLCCIDDTPKNTESYFIGASLKLLASDWREDGIVVSYADEEYGHVGTIYKASNFTMTAKTKGAKVIIHNGKRYHDKAIRTKYKGKLKPFAENLKQALADGSAQYKETAGKFTYVYYLSKNVRKQLNRKINKGDGLGTDNTYITSLESVHYVGDKQPPAMEMLFGD